MEQLIVLGQIPGTHFQLTFGWFQLVFWPIVGFASYRFYKARIEKLQQQTQRHYDVISLRSLEQA
jgi:hypothetical protein